MTRPRLVHLLAKDHLARKAGAVAEAIRAEGVAVQKILTRDGAQVAQLLRQNLNDIEHLVIAGGDGLIHLAVQVMAETGIPVGIIPVGSGNDIARGLGLAKRPVAGMASAARRALEEPAPMDLIRVGDNWAVSVLTAGFSGRVNLRANGMRWPRGQFKYTLATLRELGSLTPAEIGLESASYQCNSERSLLIAIGNTRFFGGGMAICPEANPVDGLLHVVSVAPVPVHTFGRVLPRSFTGGHVRHPAVSSFRTSELTIETAELLWADGEALACDASGGATVQCVSAALQVAGFRPT